MRALLQIGVLALVCALPCAARADSASEAELHYTLGLELYKQHKYEEALQHLIASNRLVPNANVVFNVAQTYGLLHRDADAFNWYQTYLDFKTLDADARERGVRAAAALAPKLAVLQVTSTPPGAELFVDRVELGSVGAAPRKLAVAPGERTVIAQLPGFHEARGPAIAAAGQEVQVALTLTPVVGILKVQTEPPGAEVIDDESGKSLGNTPLRLERPLGDLRLTLRADGYVEQQRQVTIREEAEAEIKLTLTAAASRVSVLSVQGAPAGARVSLSGAELGAVPLVASGLKPGSVLLEVAAPEREPFRQQIVLEPGAATRVEVQLEAPNGGPYRWLRWVGYGSGAVALVAGLITGLVAISNRNTFYSNPSRATYDLVNTENLAADTLVISGLVVAAATFVFDRLVWPARQSRGTVELAR